MAEVGLRRIAVWGFAVPIIALVVITAAERSGGLAWPEPFVDLAAFVLTIALTLAPVVGIVAALLLIAQRR